MSDHILFHKFKAFNIGKSNLSDDQKYIIDHTKAKQMCLNMFYNDLRYSAYVENYIDFIHKKYENIEDFIEKIIKFIRTSYVEEFPLQIESIYEAIVREENYIKEKYGQIYDKDYLFQLILINYTEEHNCSRRYDIIDKFYFDDLDYKFIHPVENRTDPNSFPFTY